MVFINLISHRKYEFISLLTAVVIVILCALCVTSDRPVLLKKQTNVPYISIVKDSTCAEQSFSAGFFLPTGRNVHCHAPMPTLKCDIEVVDVRSINVFTGREKSAIVSAIDLLQNTIPYNILSGIHISEVHMMADMDLNVMADGVSCENILTGDRYNATHWTIDSESSVLICKVGDMVFSSPGGFSQVLPAEESFLEDWYGNIKFLRLKPFLGEH
ncbi:MAG: hypothetical protein LBQ23_00465 [Puniceicoccales bacterium]|jgi:hypothetical protein|nr:hypothetical protein [Puniceicoccales bacterium]